MLNLGKAKKKNMLYRERMRACGGTAANFTDS